MKNVKFPFTENVFINIYVYISIYIFNMRI